jgi:glycosyltransferase involved in cell wall biosynthesis
MPYLPAPETNGGRLRAAHLARALATGADLTLYARVAGQDTAFEESRGARLIAPFGEVHTFRWPRRLALDPRLPRAAREMPAALGQQLAADHKKRPFDAVVVAQCQAAASLPALPGAALVVDEHNIESAYHRQAFQADRTPDHAWQWLAMRRFERALWRRAQGVTTVTERDAAEVRAVRPGPVQVIPNGIAISSYRYIPPSARASHSVLFVGMLSYEPNERAALFLATEVLPRLRRLVPDATLTLAGRDPTPRLLSLASAPVQIPGTLPDVAPLFDTHGAYALPLQLGAGSSLKTLEPLAAGLPLVSSPFGVRGYELMAGRDYLEASSADDFARTLARVLTSPAGLDQIASSGYAVAARHDWARLGLDFADFVRGVTEGRPRLLMESRSDSFERAPG